MSQKTHLNLENLKQEAQAFAPKITTGRQLVLLSGPLGAGKTQFLRFVLEALSVKEASSPTFAIHNEYIAPFGSIDHVDLYRLKDDADLESTGFWDLFTKSQGLIFVEWADRLPLEDYPSTWDQWGVEIERIPGSDFRNLKIEMR